MRWQYGLGRSAVFTSDAKDRWATNWVAWDGFDTFWSNALRDILPRAAPTDTETEYDAASDEIVVRYRPSREPDAASVPELFAIGPPGYRHVTSPEAGERRVRGAIPGGGPIRPVPHPAGRAVAGVPRNGLLSREIPSFDATVRMRNCCARSQLLQEAARIPLPRISSIQAAGRSRGGWISGPCCWHLQSS